MLVLIVWKVSCFFKGFLGFLRQNGRHLINPIGDWPHPASSIFVVICLNIIVDSESLFWHTGNCHSTVMLNKLKSIWSPLSWRHTSFWMGVNSCYMLYECRNMKDLRDNCQLRVSGFFCWTAREEEAKIMKKKRC